MVGGGNGDSADNSVSEHSPPARPISSINSNARSTDCTPPDFSAMRPTFSRRMSFHPTC